MRGYDGRQDRGSSPDDLVFNALLTNALYDYLARQGRMLDELCAEEAGQAPVEVRKKADGSYRIGRTVRGAAALLLACTLLFGTMMGTVEAFRVKVYNIIISFSESSDAPSTSGNGAVPQTGTYLDDIFPEWLPANYRMIDTNVKDGITTIEYSDGNTYLVFEKQDITNTGLIDAGRFSGDLNIEVNGHPGSISTIKSETFLLWTTDKFLLKIHSDLSVDEVTKIAESVYIN